MRTTRNFTRRSSALVLAGALAFAGAACGDDEGTDTDVEVTEDAPAGGGETEVTEETTIAPEGTEEDMGGTETATE